jgi:hypothetical protein
MAATRSGDEQYYEAVPPGSFAERLLIRARDRIYRDFMAMARPTPDSSILDFGVSTVVGAGANLLERLYPHPGQVTAVGLGEGGAFVRAYPLVRYVRVDPGTPLPFADGAFEIAAANAVLEHVGSRQAQRAALTELRRVARRIFVTVPNRFFPVEHHTGVPLLHYADATFRWACHLVGSSKWADPANLILMSPRRLARLGGDMAGCRIGYTGFRLGPFSSNLYLAIGCH